MPSDRLKQVFKQEVLELHETGIAKGKENIVTEVKRAQRIEDLAFC